MMLTEKTDIPLASMANIALINAKKASMDARIVHQEYRNYYTNDNGTLQLVGYTSEKLFQKDKKDMEDLLNGLTVINN